tara:strand:- start:57 stop:347 length:291 start_codon:yes stop_codon:yes gene_type:complete
MLTRKKNKVQLYPSENVIEDFYKALVAKDERKLKQVHIPKSDVFYVRKAIYMDTGTLYSLDHVERAMYLEGHLRADEVLEPKQPRGYCSYDTNDAR